MASLVGVAIDEGGDGGGSTFWEGPTGRQADRMLLCDVGCDPGMIKDGTNTTGVTP